MSTDLFIEQLNAAKGRLQTVLHRGLFEPCDHLFKAKYACRKETLYDYQNHLFDIGVWPLETIFMKTYMTEILQNLTKFEYEAKSSACGECRRDYKGMVKRIRERVLKYFDGLCLDCLDRSKSKLNDADADYWCHATLKEHEWVRGCRFPHKQPTWYFSFNGRKEDRDRLVKEKGLDPRSTESKSWYHHGRDHSPDGDDESEQGHDGE